MRSPIAQLRWLLILSVCLALAGCRNSVTSPLIGRCAAQRSLAVIVIALDSVSRASVTDSAHGVVQSGTYVDSLQLYVNVLVGGELGSELAGGDKLGTYQVTVDRPGYREWVRGNVQVTQRGPCGNVMPVQLTALLQRAS